MSYHDEVLFLVPEENLTEGRFTEAMVTLTRLHDDDVEIEFEPEDPSAPLFSRTPAPDILLDGWEYWMIASTISDEVMNDPEDFDDLPESPEFMGLFRIWVDGDALYEDEDAWQTFSEALVAIFDALGAVAAYHGTDNDYSAIGDAAEIFTMPVPDFVMFAKENVTPEERETLTGLFNNGGESGTGYWFRQGTQYDDSMSKEQMALFKRVHLDIWRRDPRLHGDRMVPEVEELGPEESEEEGSVDYGSTDTGIPPPEPGPEGRGAFEDLERLYERSRTSPEAPTVPGAVGPSFIDTDPATGYSRFNGRDEYPGGAFLWVYFPAGNFTSSTCMSFVADLHLYDGGLLSTEPRDAADLLMGRAAILERGHLALEGLELPVTPDRSTVTTDLNLVVTSGTDDLTSFGPFLEREGSVGLMVRFKGACGLLGSPEHLFAFHRVMDLVVRHFHPTYGFGFKGFGRFANMYRSMPPPEDRYWPYNVYDLEAFPADMRSSFLSWADRATEWWSLRIVDGRYALFLYNNLKASPDDLF